MELDRRRPRLSKQLGEQIDAARGQTSFDAYVRTLVTLGLGVSATPVTVTPPEKRKKPPEPTIKPEKTPSSPPKRRNPPLFNRAATLGGAPRPIKRSS